MARSTCVSETVIGNSKKGETTLAGGLNRNIGDGAKHGHAGDAGRMQATHTAVEPHLLVQPAQIFDIDQRQFATFQFGKSRRARAQAARPAYRPVEELAANQELRFGGQC